MQRILIIRFSSLGDVVLSTSPLRTIRKSNPYAKITFLTLNTYAPILENHPDIDRLLTIEKSWSIKQLWDFSKYIADKDYNTIYDLHNSIRSNLVMLRSRSIVYQLKKPRIRRTALFYFHKNYFDKSFSTLRMYHENLGEIYDENDLPPTKLILNKHEIKRGIDFIGSKGINNEYFVAVPGSAWLQKQWSPKKYARLFDKLNSPVVILGLSSDTICYRIGEMSGNVLNLAGQTSFREAMAVMYNAIHVIGSDTGLVHMAEALGKNATMILGPTSRETGGGLYLPESKMIESDVWCRPCSQNGSFPCYREHQYCMNSINVEEVLKALPRV